MSEQLVNACALILAVRLPPDAEPILLEKQRVAREFVQAAAHLRVLHAAAEQVTDEPHFALVTRMIKDQTAVCERLIERLLQLSASVPAPSKLQ